MPAKAGIQFFLFVALGLRFRGDERKEISAPVPSRVGIAVAIGRRPQRRAAELAFDLQLPAGVALIFAQQRAAMLGGDARGVARDMARLVTSILAPVPVVAGRRAAIVAAGIAIIPRIPWWWAAAVVTRVTPIVAIGVAPVARIAAAIERALRRPVVIITVARRPPIALIAARLITRRRPTVALVAAVVARRLAACLAVIARWWRPAIEVRVRTPVVATGIAMIARWRRTMSIARRRTALGVSRRRRRTARRVARRFPLLLPRRIALRIARLIARRRTEIAAWRERRLAHRRTARTRTGTWIEPRLAIILRRPIVVRRRAVLRQGRRRGEQKSSDEAKRAHQYLRQSSR
jgi:hypothetical protein